MSHQIRFEAAITALLMLLGAGVAMAAAGETADARLVEKENHMADKATGTFEAEMTPQSEEAGAEDAGLSRMLMQKTFQGDLEATSRGRFLGVYTEVEGSAGYVAIERVSGTLDGRTGSFVLQHSGTMDRGAQELTIRVVPDSGTGELEGIDGQMSIQIVDGEHRYEFEYSLPETS